MFRSCRCVFLAGFALLIICTSVVRADEAEDKADKFIKEIGGVVAQRRESQRPAYR